MTKAVLQAELIARNEQLIRVKNDLETCGSSFEDLHNRAQAIRRAEPHRRDKERKV